MHSKWLTKSIQTFKLKSRFSCQSVKKYNFNKVNYIEILNVLHLGSKEQRKQKQNKTQKKKPGIPIILDNFEIN